MLNSLIITILSVFTAVSPASHANELLERKSFSSETLTMELGSSNGMESRLNLPFVIHEDVDVVVTPAEDIPGVTLTAKVIDRGFASEQGEEPIKYLQVLASADYSAKAVKEIPVGVRVIGKESGIVHYLQNIKVTVEPKVTLRVALEADGSVKWLTPETISLSTVAQPVTVVFVLVKNEKGEPLRIHSQGGGPIPHAPSTTLLQTVGDTYEVVVDSVEPAKNFYWEHFRQGSQDQRVILFNMAE